MQVEVHNTTSLVEDFKSLQPQSYTYRTDVEAKQQYFGFVAQEMQELYPALVQTSKDGLLSIAYDDVLALVTLMLQERMTVLDDVARRAMDIGSTIKENQEERILAVRDKLERIRRELESVKDLHRRLDEKEDLESRTPDGFLKDRRENPIFV